ncbi:alpha/beta hydrolase [Leucobacter coleopterorum]|uniref:Alpha/beta hydrolase n=1 Tax=Leucobacter coleopterorum TaxID=2714933 RepID=A0ABX6JVD5_9MICO|nr:alpha/beta fold hydrolase [Leucobacter coleopterorum]QIM18198.1 alpha/beta hydrolase [Leucobacter coleopterorum]
MNDIWYPIGQKLVARDLWVETPLDWSQPDGETIRVYAREVVDATRQGEDLPLLVFLQGGPGGKSPRPLDADGWIASAVKRFRVILPDQRGTGRSTPLSAADFAVLTPEEGARRLALHRADSIVRDFEALRERHFSGRQWWTLGQSYGGFLTLQYLSHFPQSVVASAITGGIPSIDPDPAVVYARTFPRIAEKNRLFRARHPQLVARIDRVADLLASSDVRLPSGDRLTVRRLQLLGLDFGMKPGFDRVHWIFDEAFADEAETRLSDVFLAEVEAATSFATNPLFIALQEAIYGPGPSAWAAQRERERHPEFAEDARPLSFTGETVFPWMFSEISPLRGFEAAVEHLATHEQPIELYDVAVLARNEVPVEAAVYYDDMYVDAQLSLETAGRIAGLHAWVTNEFEHDGLRLGDVAERLFAALEVRLGGTKRSREL